MADVLPGAKDFARAKWKSGRRGRGRGRGGPGRSVGQPMPGQADEHYSDASTEHAQLSEGSAAGSGDEGPQPKSTGADLAELLEQSQLQYSQAYYRHRGMQQELVAELPPGLDSQQGDALAVDLEALAASLQHLPLHMLLGVPPEYCEELTGPQQPTTSTPAVPAATAVPAQTLLPAQAPTAARAASVSQPQPAVPLVSQAAGALPSPRQQAQQQPLVMPKQPLVAAQQPLVLAQQPLVSTQQPLVATAAPAPRQQPKHGSASVADELDELLGLGQHTPAPAPKPQLQQSGGIRAVPAGTAAATAVPARPLVQIPAAVSSAPAAGIRPAAGSITLPPSASLQAAAKPQPLAARPAAASSQVNTQKDDDLDELLGILTQQPQTSSTAPASAPAMAAASRGPAGSVPAASQAAGTGPASKTSAQSLEDWLGL